MTLMPLSEAAERLGVTTRQVQHLVASGDVRSLARGVVDATSVERLLTVRGGSHTRAWSEPTAWGALSLLSGGDAAWMGETQRSRLRTQLRAMTADELVRRTRNRAEVSRYRAHSSAGQYLLGVLVYPIKASARLGLAEPTEIDGYLASDDVLGVTSSHGLIRDDEGRVTLRATTMDLDLVRRLADNGIVLAALDLAESLDVRERGAGHEALEDALVTFRG